MQAIGADDGQTQISARHDGEKEGRKTASACWKFALWGLTTSVMFTILLPINSAAQAGSTASGIPPQTAGYGTGVPALLQFAGESTPTNVVTLSTGVGALYDDNVQARNSARFRDEALSFDSHLGISRKTQNVVINFDYTPFFMLYRQFDQLDRLNHVATLTMNFRISSHFIVALRDNFSYQNGVYPTLTGQQTFAGPASPTALNPFIFSPTVRTLSNMPGLDLTLVKSSRSSLTFSGNYNQRKFASQAGVAQPLYNDTSASGSIQYQYRTTVHTTFGALLLYQDSTYAGGGGLGNRQRAQIASTVLSVDSRLSPTVAVSIFGGPQYIHTFGQKLAGQVEASAGGSITKEVQKTALNLAVQRAASDGGGVFTSVINSSATLGVRRRLAGRWQASWTASVAQEDASLLRLGNGKADTLTGGMDLIRSLGTGGTTFRISYSSIHQLTKGNVPALVDFDRNQVTIAFDYQFKTIPVGR